MKSQHSSQVPEVKMTCVCGNMFTTRSTMGKDSTWKSAPHAIRSSPGSRRSWTPPVAWTASASSTSGTLRQEGEPGGSRGAAEGPRAVRKTTSEIGSRATYPARPSRRAGRGSCRSPPLGPTHDFKAALHSSSNKVHSRPGYAPGGGPGGDRGRDDAFAPHGGHGGAERPGRDPVQVEPFRSITGRSACWDPGGAGHGRPDRDPGPGHAIACRSAPTRRPKTRTPSPEARRTAKKEDSGLSNWSIGLTMVARPGARSSLLLLPAAQAHRVDRRPGSGCLQPGRRRVSAGLLPPVPVGDQPVGRDAPAVPVPRRRAQGDPHVRGGVAHHARERRAVHHAAPPLRDLVPVQPHDPEHRGVHLLRPTGDFGQRHPAFRRGAVHRRARLRVHPTERASFADNAVVRFFAQPGLWLQHITTKEPDPAAACGGLPRPGERASSDRGRPRTTSV